MTRTRTFAALLAFLFITLPTMAAVGTKHHQSTSSATLYFSGTFSYSVGSGKARVTAQDVANTGGSTTGPLRFSLWWTPNSPFPSAGSNTAQYSLGTLAPGQHLTNVDSGVTLPFTDPGNGCYYVALVLEQFVGGVWQTEDYGNFSARISSGQGCLFSFTGSPTTISPGGSSTLSWSSGGTGVTIDNGIGLRAANGSVQVTPASTTTYTLTVNGTADAFPRTGQVTVTVTQPAPTATFSAAPTSIGVGGSSMLTWTTTNATSVSIDHGLGTQPLSGSVSVSPSATTTYTLTANGPGGQITRQATVTITGGPAITFVASPPTIAQGGSSLLTWQTNGTSVSIDNGIGTKPASGSVNVSPATSTTYVLTATGPGGTSTASVRVTVVGAPTVTITATPGVIANGGSATLSWSSTNGIVAAIDHGIGAVSLGGSMVVTPASTTTYTITVTGAGGTVDAHATVVVGAVGRRRAARH